VNQLRVLHIISEIDPPGGAEALVVELVTRGASLGWRSAIATSSGNRVNELFAAGVDVHHVHLPQRSPLGVLRAAADARRAVRRYSPDVAVAHNVSASVVGRLATLGMRLPVLTVFHGVAPGDYRNAARLLSRTSSCVVAVSEAIAGRLLASGLRGRQPRVIRNAVDTRPVDQDAAAARQELGLDEGVPVALCLARMEPQKRHDVLIDAWASVPEPALLLLAGDGSLRPELEARARTAGLGDRVRFLGNRSDVQRLLRAADITVLTSDWEGLPIAVLESLAADRPVVATDVDGLREVIGDGGGRLVAPRDPAGTAAAVRELLEDPVARAAAAAAGRRTLERYYDPDRMVAEYDMLFRGQMERR
jgi:glycosyltransferase involved in cell wall biosynthesis